MKIYPEVITGGTLEINAHLSDEQIEQDIADTEAEILQEAAKADAYHILAEPGSCQEARMNSFREDAARNGIRERREFVAFLRRLLEARGKERR